MRKFLNGRLGITLGFAAILVLCQFIPQRGLPTFNGCSGEWFYTYYGFPAPVVITATSRCDGGDQTTDVYGPLPRIPGLLIDILFVAVLSYSLSLLLPRLRKFVNGRQALTLLFFAILVLCQFIPERARSFIDICNIDTYGTIEHFSTSYGFPMPAMGTSTTIDGCSGNQTTNINGISADGLVVDTLFVIVLGMLPYLFSLLLHRFRRRDSTE